MIDPHVKLAIQDFRRARRQADLEVILARLTGRSTSLLSYEEVRKKLKGKKSGKRVLREIPLDDIVGSVGRYNDFTRSFLPRLDQDRDRWASVKASVDAMGFQPVDVYQIGEAYFVLDGHHRVSIARQLGAETIPAVVIKVQTRVPFSPDDSPDDLIIKSEYVDFLERTHLDKLRPKSDLSVTAPGQYRILIEQIESHQHALQRDLKQEVLFETAAAHWHDNFYLPVIQVIRERGILRDFPHRTETDLYLWVSRHRHTLEKELGWEIEPGEVTAGLLANYHPSSENASHVGEKILETLVPKELSSGPPPGQWRQERLAVRQDERLFADVLIAVSGDESGWRALDQALILAQREDSHLHGLHVLASENEKKLARAQRVREEFDRRCQEARVQGELTIEKGRTSRLVCERARWTDLVILSLNFPPSAQPVSRLSSGLSTILRRCPRPVLTVPGTPSKLERPLLAYDGSRKADEALFLSAYLAARRELPLVVVTVIEFGRTTLASLEYAEKYLRAKGIKAQFIKEQGPVAAAILRTAEAHACDLIMMGGYGFNPVMEIVLGSAVDEVLRTTRTPVLICR
jgi:nucleotide-binding universal stress UspA family protein